LRRCYFDSGGGAQHQPGLVEPLIRAFGRCARG
jgi:hypothetical protein